MNLLEIITVLATINFVHCGPSEVGAYDLTQLIPIELSAVGRVAKLGELYDARADQFLHLSISKSTFPNTSIASTQNKETKLKYTLVNSFEEKFQTLDVSAEVKLSVLGGLFELQGSGRYFKDTKTSAKSAKASLIQSFSTTYDMVSITDSAVNPLINDDVLAQIDATHVVVGIQWGGNVFISVEDLNQDDRDVQKVEGNLGVKIKLLAASLSGKGLVNVSDADKNEINKFSFEIYGDLVPDSVPQTLIDAVEFMKISPSLLQKANEGKGKAMKYTLLPLPALRKLWKINTEINALVNRVDEATIKNCVKMFDEMNVVSQKLNDVVLSVNQYEQYITTSKVKEINDLKYNYEIYQAEVQRNLSDHLVKVRSGSEGVDKLQDVIIQASKHNYSWENINTNELVKVNRQVSFIKQLLTMGITLHDKNKMVQDFLWENYGKDVYILFYNYDPNIISDKKLNLFRKMVDNKNGFGPKAMFVAAEYSIVQDDDIQKSNLTNKISLYRNGTMVIPDYNDGDKTPDPSKPELWSFYQLQQHVMSVEQQMVNMNKVDTDHTAKINNLYSNPVPIGFTYTQFVGQAEPGKIWPGTQWAHISPNYAGLFFRVEGGGSLPFGQVQPQSYNRITAFKGITLLGLSYNKYFEKQYDLVEGQWSGVPGDTQGGNCIDYLNFYSTKVDNFPKNQAIRIWQRVK